MNRLSSLALPILLLIVLALPGAANGAEVPEQSGYVSDYAEIIDAKTEIALALILGTMEEKYGNRLVILTVESTAPLDIEGYSVEVFREWDLGRDDLLFLVALQDGKVRLDAGRRLNKLLTDEKLGEIMEQEIMPPFSEGDFSQGILRGTVALTSAIKEIRKREAQRQTRMTWITIGLIAIAAVALLLVLRS
ncbi:MAG TPA: TPM domain-containing protein [Candidatus Latescibacteria bacterium]|nr:TPM domain-containing protein [Candidatus Latescibacterota bacterium]